MFSLKVVSLLKGNGGLGHLHFLIYIFNNDRLQCIKTPMKTFQTIPAAYTSNTVSEKDGGQHSNWQTCIYLTIF